MMDTISNYKNRALADLEGNWKEAAIATLIYTLILEVPMIIIGLIIPFLGNIWMFFMLPLMWGFYILFLNLTRGEKIEYKRMFDGFHDWQRIGVTLLLMILYVFLWMLLFIVPGIIKSLSYSMTYYILKDDPQIKEEAAIELSKQMMEGHKMELFKLQLSFIGWALLSILSLGIGLFFLIPYMNTAFAHFYEDLKAETASTTTIATEI